MTTLLPLSRRVIARAALALLLAAAFALAIAAAFLPGLSPTPTLTPPPAEATNTVRTVTSLTISSAGADNEWVTGDTIVVTATTNLNVVSVSNAALSIQIGSNTRTATVTSHTCGLNVVFRYTVVAADVDGDGIVIPNNAISGTYNSSINHTCTGPGSHGHSIATMSNAQNCCETPQSAHLVNIANLTDYDTDDDGLIEINSAAKLNAIRYDLNGDGQVAAGDATNYAAGFPNFAPASCPDNDDPADGASYDCIGYELTADVNLSTISNFVPIARSINASYSAQFHGRGYIISNLTINNTTNDSRTGLFGSTNGATITGVGLEGVDIRTTFPQPPTGRPVGGLVGWARNTTIRYCWIRGSRLYKAENSYHIGGLVGDLENGSIAASYADVPVSNATGNPQQNVNLGGLVGWNNRGTILASYARGNLNGGYTNDSEAGGLAARNRGTIVASFATGSITTRDNAVQTGGLVGRQQSGGSVVDSYWDTTTSGESSSAGAATGQTTSALQSPTEYGTAANNDIYANWNIDLDNADGDNNRATGADDPWDFVRDNHYPVIRFEFGSDAGATTREARAREYQVIEDYDLDNDDLIEVSTLAQLNAIRYDANGTGAVSNANQANYAAAFPRARADMGCDSGAGMCDGYELAAHLDFDTSGDGNANAPYANWDPLPTYSAIFEGNGYAIANLTINRPAENNIGLFKQLASGSAVRGLGLPDADVKGDYDIGILAGSLTGGNVSAVWVSGAAAKTGTTAGSNLGGLVGFHSEGDIIAGYSTAAVDNTNGGQTSASGTGGLVGRMTSSSGSTPRIIASYATGAVTPTGSGSVNSGWTVVGGLVGRRGASANITISNSYWDTSTTGWTTSASDGSSPGTTTTGGYTTAQLQTPTAYGTMSTDIYQNWNVNVDGVAGNDDPWDFGGTSDYPILAYSAASLNAQLDAAAQGYDADNDNLIDIATLAQLNAVRLDLNGSGADGLTGNTLGSYARAFPGLSPGMGCPATCAGYELTADLDFDTDGDGDADAPYAEWTPIGSSSSAPYAARFQGNGHTISNLRLNTTGQGNTGGGGGVTGVQSVGLFGYASGTLEGVGLLNVDIDATYTANQNRRWSIGGLAGETVGLIRSSFVTGAIDITASGGPTNGPATYVGGLVGRAGQSSAVATRGVIASWADVAITVASTAPTNNSANWRDYAGGLVGNVSGSAARNVNITASYATGAVTDNRVHAAVGGLLGRMAGGTLSASYSTGAPTATNAAGTAFAGGLIAFTSNATISDSYWDTATSGVLDSTPATSPGAGKTTAELQEPTGYTGDYAGWNLNLDGDTGTGDAAGNDDPWYFVNSSHYPILKYGYAAGGIIHQLAVVNDYDADDDNLVEIGSLAQLDAVRHDRDGDGIPGSAAAVPTYLAAFPGLGYGMGCPAVCIGYELTADLDFDENGDGEITSADAAWWNDGAGWSPIGSDTAPYTGDFHGNGHTISRLYIAGATTRTHIGLFGALARGTVQRLGLPAVDLAPTYSGRSVFATGALAGGAYGTVIRYVYATGDISPTATGDSPSRTGGLLGELPHGDLLASWADVDIDLNSSSTSEAYDFAGGLVGRANVPWNVVTRVVASYARGDVEAERTSMAGEGGCAAGGLVGEIWGGGSQALGPSQITASYAANVNLACTAPNGAGALNGGLVGTMPSTNRANVNASYWATDTAAMQATTYGGRGTGLTTANLQPTEYGTTGNNFDWNDYDVDDDNGDGDITTGTADDAWHFASGAYPILKFGYNAHGIARQQGVVGATDYDADDDGLIEVATLARLNALRYDLDGDGDNTGADAVQYQAAFPAPVNGMGCPAGCAGYELTAHLDFDTNNDGTVDSMDTGSYPDWSPIGGLTPNSARYDAKFVGNGYTIANLTITTQADNNGLFLATGENSEIIGLGLPDASIVGNASTGILAGVINGRAAAVWTSGSVTGTTYPGGLAGRVSSTGNLIASYSGATVGNTTGSSDQDGAGGLAGRNSGSITASFAYGAVTGTPTAPPGGLVGHNYAAITNSNWNTEVESDLAGGSGGSATTTDVLGVSTAQLQGAAGYGADATQPYYNWNVDVDGDPSTGDGDGNDDPWDFGANDQYPVLKFTGRSLAWQGRGGFAWTQNAAAVTALTVAEDPMGSATYQVALVVAPDDDVAVTITPAHADVTVDDDNDGTFAATGTLTFTAANWDTPQTLSIRGGDDADVGDLNTALNLAGADPSGGKSGYDGVTGAIAVLVTDDDTGGIVLSVSELAVTEVDVDGSYTVALSGAPTAGVTVTIASADGGVAQVSSDNGATFANSITLTFDTTNYSMAQTVTVRGVNDSDDNNETVMLTHTAAGAGSGYENLTATLTVSVTDNDIPNIALSAATLPLDEGIGNSATYTVRLTVVPEPASATVTVTLTAAGVEIDDGGGAFGSSGTLTFDATDWNTPRTITVRAPDDNDLVDRTATIAHRAASATDSRYAGKTDDVPVMIANTETGVITLNPTALTVTEDASATYTVALGKRPAADATVTITSDNAAVTLRPSTLTFTRAGWSAARTQTVTATAAADINGADETGGTITHTGGDAVSGSDSGYGSVTPVTQTLTVLDTTAPGTALSPNHTMLTLNEGSGQSYAVTLDAAPADTVTVAIASNDPVVLLSATSLTFTTTDYNTAQLVSVAAAVDADGYHNAAAVTFTPTMRNVVGAARTLSVLVNDATPGATPQTRITPPPANAGATEYDIDSQTVTVTSNAGVPDGITVSTTQALTADLTVTLSAPTENVPARGGGFRLNAGSIVDITPSANPAGGLEVCLPRGRDAIMILRYQEGTWVEVPGSQVRGDQVCAVITQFSVFGAGRRAGAELLRPAANLEFGEGKSAQITVLVQDTTTEPVQVSWSVSAPDGGATPSDFGSTTPLSDFPTGSITIPAGSDQTATISIPIYDDAVYEGAESFTVRLTQASGGVADYNDEAITATIALSDPSLDLRGPDGPGGSADAPLTASSRLVITEGRTNTYMMALSSEPSGNVTVVIHSNHDGVTTSPASLTFTPANFATPQQVTVTASPDGDAKNEQSTLTHILTDADGVVIEIINQLSVFVADTDPPDDDDVC